MDVPGDEMMEVPMDARCKEDEWNKNQSKQDTDEDKKKGPVNRLGFMGPRDPKIRRYGDLIKRNNWPQDLCNLMVAGYVNSPTSFFLIPMDFWEHEERAMKEIQAIYNDKSDDPERVMERRSRRILLASEVKVGMYVAIIYGDEWHRGRILKLDHPGEKPYLVRLIDFGEAIPCTLFELFRLLRRFASEEFYEAAVECQLVVPYRLEAPHPLQGPSKFIRKSWDWCQRNRFRRLLFDRELQATILNKQKNEYGETMWQIFLNIYEHEPCNHISYKLGTTREQDHYKTILLEKLKIARPLNDDYNNDFNARSAARLLALEEATTEEEIMEIIEVEENDSQLKEEVNKKYTDEFESVLPFTHEKITAIIEGVIAEVYTGASWIGRDGLFNL